jgi:hypothetical protein
VSQSSARIKQAADSRTFKAKVVMIVFIVVLCTGCGGGHQSVVPPNNWQIVTYNFATNEQHVYSLSEYPWSAGIASDGSVRFMFPNYSSADEAFHSENVVRLWEVYADRQRTLDSSNNIAFAFSISAQEGSSFFWKTQQSNGCPTPPTARPMFVAWYHGAFQAADEWWADNAFTLAPESSTLQVPLAPDHWADMDGWRANAFPGLQRDFNFAKANVQAYGMSFGGGCFYGHGVSTIGGTAEFEVQVQPDLESQ